MEKREIDAMGDRHDEIREQLSLMEGWVEGLPLARSEERHAVMLRIVDFLQRYVLVDARREERELFPSAGARADVLRAEHGFIERWVRELEGVARESVARESQDAQDAAAPGDPGDGVRFRATAYRLFGLLEAHMHCEEVVLAQGTAQGTAQDAGARGP